MWPSTSAVATEFPVAERLDETDLAGVAGCKHADGPAMRAVGRALDAFFTPARANALRAALEAELPSVQWTNPRMMRAIRAWVEAR